MVMEKQIWWLDPKDNDSFKICKLDDYYNENYFKDVCNHINNQEASDLVEHLPKVSTVLEIGMGGGWITKELMKFTKVTSVEGSKFGIAKAIVDDIQLKNIIQHDLRYELNLEQKFDLVTCIEVAEHIEIPFSSVLIKTLINHGDLVYFTFVESQDNKHVHHCNLQPLKFWESIFDFYGFQLKEKMNGKYHRSQGYFFSRNTRIL